MTMKDIHDNDYVDWGGASTNTLTGERGRGTPGSAPVVDERKFTRNGASAVCVLDHGECCESHFIAASVRIDRGVEVRVRALTEVLEAGRGARNVSLRR